LEDAMFQIILQRSRIQINPEGERIEDGQKDDKAV
jgi:hypothetical protein